MISSWFPEYNASLIMSEGELLSILRGDPYRPIRGDGNILYGFIFTTVWVNSDLITFVRDKQSIVACNSSCIGMRIEFSSNVIVVTRWLGCRDTKDIFQNGKCNRNDVTQPPKCKKHLTVGRS